MQDDNEILGSYTRLDDETSASPVLPSSEDSYAQPSQQPGSSAAAAPRRTDARIRQRAGDAPSRAKAAASRPYALGNQVPIQAQTNVRQRDKFVALPRSGAPETDEEESPHGLTHTPVPTPMSHTPVPAISFPTYFPPPLVLPPISGRIFAVPDARELRGRITVFCIAEGFNRPALEVLLTNTHPSLTLSKYPEVLHLGGAGSLLEGPGEAFFFDYGVICCWDMSPTSEAALRSVVSPAVMVEPLPKESIEIDEFQFRFSVSEPPHIQNDVITINRRQAADHHVRLAITHALAQSIKLSSYETRVVQLVDETRTLPEVLARLGRVPISPKRVAQLIGKVFLQSSAVNLLSTVLDTPEWFWTVPDYLQALYERICEYLELDERTEVLNTRFAVLQEMLDMLREHQNNFHTARLEWIIIWLLVIDVALMFFQLLSLFHIV